MPAITPVTLTAITERQDAAAECYRFADTAGVWRYTSADTDQLADLGDGAIATYVSAAIGRGELAYGPEEGRRSLEVTLPRDMPLAARFIGAASQIAMTVTLWRRYASADAWTLLWSGRVLTGALAGHHLRLRCEPASVAMKRTALRRLYSCNCPHVLYGPECKATPQSVIETVSWVASSTLMYLTGNTDYSDYSGGWLVAPDGVAHMIKVGGGNSIETIYPSGLAVGQQFQMFKGCDHSIQTCQARFANTNNFGGYPWIPKKNPFSDNVF